MSIKKYKALFNDKEEEELRTKLCINISGNCAFIIPLSKYGSFFLHGEEPLVNYSLSFFGYHQCPFLHMNKYRDIHDVSNLLALYVTRGSPRWRIVNELISKYAISRNKAECIINKVWRSLI